MLGNHFAIEVMAKEHQQRLRAEAAHERLVRELTGRAARPVNELRWPRLVAWHGRLLARLRGPLGGSPQPTATREPVG
jgi:hypothetical protein